jgi:hypothetical protein
MVEGIYEDSTYIISKKETSTPKEYDRLILHLIMFYLLLISIFISGYNGLISVIFASYLLY